MVQKFHIRLIESMLQAFRDPDFYFCRWWAKGVWLGSPTRKLPRTPAVFDRKTKWRFQEMPEEGQGDWQRNYDPVEEHASLVERHFL